MQTGLPASISLDLPAELDLLLQSVKVALGSLEKPEPKDPIDWDLLLEIARWHRLVWPLFNAADQLPDMPQVAREQLEADHRETAGHNLRLTAALVSVTNLLNKHQIPFLTLKGMPLAQAALGDIGRRRSRDLDILVRPRDAVQARDLLHAELGFVPDMELDPRGMELLLRTEKELKMYAGDLLLELHWSYAHMPGLFPGIQPGDPRATEEVLGGLPVPVLPPDDLFSYLAYHGASHFWFRFFWLADLAFLAQRRPPDWSTLLERAREIGQERATAFSLGLTHLLMDGPMPEPVRKVWEQQPELTGYASEWIALFRRKPAPGQAYDIPAPLARVYKWFLRMYPHLRGRIFARALFQPSIHDMLAFPLPRPLHPLYYVTRPFRLASRILMRR